MNDPNVKEKDMGIVKSRYNGQNEDENSNRDTLREALIISEVEN